MKSASFPSLRVKAELRNASEQVLLKGETLSSFIESSIRANIDRRLSQRELIARGLASRDRARINGEYVNAELVIERLQEMLLEAKKKRH